MLTKGTTGTYLGSSIAGCSDSENKKKGRKRMDYTSRKAEMGDAMAIRAMIPKA